MPAFLPARPVLRGAVYTALGAVAPLLCETFQAMGVDTSGSSVAQIIGPIIGLVLGGGAAAGAYRDATLVDHRRREVRRMVAREYPPRDPVDDPWSDDEF